MLWVKEVEIATSVDDPLTSQSTELRDFLDLEMLDSKIATNWRGSSLISSSEDFNVKEQTAQKYERFLRGRQIACVPDDHFRATGAHDAAPDPCQIFSDFPHTRRWRSSINCKWKTWNVQESVCTSCRYEILFSFRPYWPCMNKKLSETEQCQATKDWRQG